MLSITPTRGRGRTRRAAVAAALAAGLTAAALPTGAQAAEVESNSAVVTYRAAPGEVNRPSITLFNGELAILDAVPLRPRGSCVSLTTTEVRCPVTGPQQIRMQLGDRDDNVIVAVPGATATSLGEAGNDVYSGGFVSGSSRVDFQGGPGGFDAAVYAAADAGVIVTKDGAASDGRAGQDADNVRADVEELFGSRFSDSLNGTNEPGVIEQFHGGAGKDVLSGNDGPDEFHMSPAADGADRVLGGPGQDRAFYNQRTRRVVVNLTNGLADDGEIGEGDEVVSVERVVGGEGRDTLRAIRESASRFELFGGPGEDSLIGGAGGDLLDGGPGGDNLQSFGGNDVIEAVDGEQDVVECGDGPFDRARTDFSEFRVLGCERRDLIAR
jgi:hypothetical protein